jgi:hypothetical protein
LKYLDFLFARHTNINYEKEIDTQRQELPGARKGRLITSFQCNFEYPQPSIPMACLISSPPDLGITLSAVMCLLDRLIRASAFRM